ncbi:MAG: helix-turn-helix transcriptional regulator [Deltaproteobacteria bacterium]|nr:helix-turn-helix transcriptional regulator [Deltaproteobacteria bacterium]
MDKSERDVAEEVGLSRSTLRQVEAGVQYSNMKSLRVLAEYYGRDLHVFLTPTEDSVADSSSYGVSLKVKQDGFSSWKIHFMDFVDAYRRSLDPRLLVFPPTKGLDIRLRALLASIVTALCLETGESVPGWAKKSYFLKEPWFVSEVENLKAMSILESQWPFRRNNIFVLGNFLKRA